MMPNYNPLHTPPQCHYFSSVVENCFIYLCLNVDNVGQCLVNHLYLRYHRVYDIDERAIRSEKVRKSIHRNIGTCTPAYSKVRRGNNNENGNIITKLVFIYVTGYNY